jgi:RND family efflux transporter MFP subunit
MKFKMKQGPLGIAVTAVVIALLCLWMFRRAPLRGSSPEEASALPAADVSKVTRGDLFKEVTIAAEFRPYVEVALPAKVTGYVDKMNVDFGDTVKAGQLLATLEVPELQAQLDNAIAVEQKAQADYTNANLIYSRLQSVNLNHPNLVAQQELDTADANDLTAAAAIAAAKAEVEKYQTMVGYTRIIAPFDGIVTYRYADPGTLIDAQGKPIVRVSDNYRLRLDFPVTVDYVKDIHLGDPVEVRIDSLGGKTLSGKISRFTHDVNDDTRTMLTEIEVPNPDLELVPGMYASVILRVEQRLNALAIPIEAVSSEQNPTVLVINGDQQIEERPVKLGVETPDKFEVLSGLQEGDMVVVGNRTQFQVGEKVKPKFMEVSMLDGN